MKLSSHSVGLRPVMPTDIEWCYALMCGAPGDRWRYRGRTPSPEQLSHDLWRGVYSQFVVVDRRTEQAAGLVGLYSVSIDAGRAHAFAVADPRLRPVVTQGFGLLCQWAFQQLCVQRIIVEVPEFNLRNFASLGDAATIEGRLRNYEVWQGRLWDLVFLVITAESFESRFGALMRRLHGLPSQADQCADSLSGLVEGLWPIDSLGAVEVLEHLECMLNQPVDPSLLDAVDADSPSAFAEQLLELALAASVSDAPSYASGSSFRPPGSPEGSSTSSSGGPVRV